MTRGATVLLIALSMIALGACVGNSAATSTTPNIVVPGDPAAGANAYEATCSNCHGRDLEGVEGLGNPLAPNEYVADASEDDLAALIILGRPRDHPDNATGLDMLPRGGNPLLSDQSVQDIAAYLKTQN